MSDSDFEKIKPADFDLPARPSHGTAHRGDAAPLLGEAEERKLENYQLTNTRILWGIFGILFSLAVGVVIILPGFISTPAIQAPPPSLETAASPTASPAKAPQISPFEEAQRLKQREDAQNVLAQLLELQDSLEQKSAQNWAQEAFNNVFEQARAGDEAYRQQQFVQARDYYQQGVNILQDIEASVPAVFSDFMAEGSRALLDGSSEQALQAFRFAVAIDADSLEAQSGLERAGVLNDVLELLEAGVELHEDNQLEAARDLYQQALAIDPDHAASDEALAKVNQDILDRDFSSLMSQGYASLQAGSPEEAEQTFNRAVRLKPESAEAKAAIGQAQDQITSREINRHLSMAAEFEGAESWQPALEQYNNALAIDPNVVAAIDGRNKAQSRLNLDNFLVNTIENPLRLAEDGVYQQTLQVYNDANRIPAPGPRLRSQLQQVNDFLQKARQPLNVSLKSDGLTTVTVYQVGPLGQFNNHTLSLRPGNYTAVGVREGYRDVRTEFVVSFDGQPPVVTVACNEEIL